MDHALIRSIEQALGWHGAMGLGADFARGSMANTELCSRLLTPQRLLDVVMRRSLAPPQFRCFENGNELHPDVYLTRQVTRRGQSLPMVNMDRVGQLLRSGCTVVLDALDTFDPTMEVACRALQWWSREVVQVNTYLTTADAPGFSLHWDDHDVVIVQIAGEKSWEVRGTSRAVPMYRDAEPNTAPSRDVVWSGTMKAGDVMHIPRGYWHQATRTDRGDGGFSLHVTFGFVKRTGVDWLTWVADRSREREPFRHDLDRSGPEAQALQQKRLVDELLLLLADYPVAEFLARRERERPPPREVATADVFGEPTAVVCVAEFRPHIVDCGETVDVYACGKRLSFLAKAQPALARLLSGHPVELVDVSNETGVDATVLAKTLIKEGVCAEVTEELSSGCTGLIPAGI